MPACELLLYHYDLWHEYIQNLMFETSGTDDQTRQQAIALAFHIHLHSLCMSLCSHQNNPLSLQLTERMRRNDRHE